MISTKINAEIAEYHEKLLAGMSIRQLLCAGAAIVLAVATFAVGTHFLHLSTDLLSYVVMAEVMPLLGLGFIRRNGYPFEKLVQLYWRTYTENHRIPFKEKVSTNAQKRKGIPCECQTAAAHTKAAAKSRAKAACQSIAAAKKELREVKRQNRKADKTAASA